MRITVLTAGSRGDVQPFVALGAGLKAPEAPHDWIFPKCAAVVHHGGAGTTAAGLRAGRPTIICLFFGDQPFWGARVDVLGVGPKPLPQRRLTADRLAAAIETAASDESMRSRAAALGHKMQAEDGVTRAVEVINQRLANRR